jgi:hypothetical protein
VEETAYKELCLSLLQRLNEATVINHRTVRIGDWTPERRHCHENVTIWIESNPQQKPIRGFLCFTFDGLLGFVQFQPHTVVEVEDGTLIDITPNDASQEYPFLRHTGTADEFEVIAETSIIRCHLAK